MRIYLVRHGETDWNVQDLTQGWTDIPLNAHGAAQAQSLADKIKQTGITFDAVYSSPLRRVYRTAEIATNGKYQIITDNRLKERNCGEFEGKPREAILGHDIDFLDPEVNSGAFDVEPINDMTARVHDFLKSLQATYPNDAKILIFTSNGVILRTAHILTKAPLGSLPRFQNAEIYEYEL